MNESEVQQRIQVEAMRYGCNLMRNNSGRLQNERGNWISFGLGNISKKHNDAIKSSDLIGFTVMTVTPEMIGHKLAVFTAIECKEEGWKLSPNDPRERAQMAFINWIATNGGIAAFCNSVESFKKLWRRV